MPFLLFVIPMLIVAVGVVAILGYLSDAYAERHDAEGPLAERSGDR